MRLENLMLKYQVTPKDLDTISECMLSDKGIFETAESLGNKLTPDQVFVIAKALCLEDHGEKLEDVAPKMMIERISINEQREPDWKCRSDYSKEVKRLNALKEDLVLLVLEREGVINIYEMAE
ncbi:hypothetical protein ACI2KR_07160 [Pseudomonas luteola]